MAIKDITCQTKEYSRQQWTLYYEMCAACRVRDLYEALHEDEEDYAGITQEEFDEAVELYERVCDNDDGWWENVHWALRQAMSHEN